MQVCHGLSLHSSAAGKVLLAGMSDEEIIQLIDRVGLEAMTPKTITDKDILLQEIHEVRKNGYAMCSGESYWAGGLRERPDSGFPRRNDRLAVYLWADSGL